MLPSRSHRPLATAMLLLLVRQASASALASASAASFVGSVRTARTGTARRRGGGTPPAALFASCPPPRFDEFSNRVLGKWTTPDGRVDEVEEVMRSCGGAVQGIKEIGILSPDGGEEKPYHNRANDGFVFFDCGCYGAGPVKLQLDPEETGSLMGGGEDATTILSSLVFPSSSSPKTRALVSTYLATEEGDKGSGVVVARNARCATLERTPWGAEDLSEQDAASTDAIIIAPCDDKVPGSVRWEREVACRMPSPGQPWMLQRVKWEQFLNPDNVSDDDTKTDTVDGSAAVGDESVHGWASATTSQKLWGHEGLDFLSSVLSSSSEEEGRQGILVQTGAFCRKTGEARAILRVYGEDRALQCVVLQEGKVC